MADVGTERHLDHCFLSRGDRAPLEVVTASFLGFFLLIEGEFESVGLVINQVFAGVVAAIEEFADDEEGVEWVDGDDDHGEDGGEAVECTGKGEGFELEDGEVEERNVADPHDNVYVDVLEPLFHEAANVPHVLKQAGAAGTARLLPLVDDQHEDVERNEAPHYDEDRHVCLQETRAVVHRSQSTPPGSRDRVAAVALTVLGAGSGGVGNHGKRVEEVVHFLVVIGAALEHVHHLTELHHSIC